LIGGCFIAAAHNTRTAVYYPGLTIMVQRGNKQTMASRSSRLARSTAGSAKPAKKETLGSVLRFILGVVMIAWAFRSFVFQPFFIPSGSMLPTLYVGDYLAVAKWPYGYSRYSFPFEFPSIKGHFLGGLPSRGDVVVFHHPAENADLIKRVIGLPGDTVEVRGGRLLLNGHAVARQPLKPAMVPISPNSPCRVVPPADPNVIVANGQPRCIYKAFLETLPGGPSYVVLDQVENGPADDFAATRVPAGHLFLMGDNRDDSLDSRFPTFAGGVGMLPVENLIGRAEFTFWSTDGSASYFRPWTWFTASRISRIGNEYTGAGK